MRASSSATRRCGSPRSIDAQYTALRGGRLASPPEAATRWDWRRRGLTLPRQRTGPLEAGLIGGGADDPEHDLAKPLDRLRPGLAVGLGDPRPLVFGELTLELDALGGQAEKALATIALAGTLGDETLLDELAQHAAQALLGDLEDAKQLRHRHFRVPADKINDTMIGATETVSTQYGVRPAGEIAIGVEQQLDALAEFLLAQEERVGSGFYVRHVD